MAFVHLHVHSAYSFLDGLNEPEDLARYAATMNMPALALTDHGGMHGIVAHVQACQAYGIRPIIGTELYLCRPGQTIHQRHPKHDQSPHHILLIAADRDGYRNLVRLSSIANKEGYYYHPRIDHQLLAQHSKGVICTTGCPKAEIPRLLLGLHEDEALKAAKWYKEVFGDRFYVELQHHQGLDYRTLNTSLVSLARSLNIKIIATNDVHYCKKEDAKRHDLLLCLRRNDLVNDPKRMRFPDDSFYLKSEMEMRALFADLPEAVTNTIEVAERCQNNLIERGVNLPPVDYPKDFANESEYFRYLCQIGFEMRYGIPAERDGWVSRRRPPRSEDMVGQVKPCDSLCAPHDVLQARLNYEIETIIKLGFSAYMLIVWDVIRFCKENNILWNIRGSAAGSMVCYVLGLTPLDPLAHELYFERFLNPHRVNMPDIDIDFPDDQRALVANYAVRRYGAEHVAQISTVIALGARAAVRAAGRILDIDLKKVDRLCDMIPNIPSRPTGLDDMASDPSYMALATQIPGLHETAKAIEGVIRGVGTHAAGIAISAKPLIEYIPVQRPIGQPMSDQIALVTQFDMRALDYLGVLKMDYLGLSQLSVIRDCLDLIRARTGRQLTIDDIPLSHPSVYNLLSKGDLDGVFQVESDGMKKVFTKMKPRCFGDIVAALALYRPGPMEFIDQYIKCMHGEAKPDYMGIPEIEQALSDTYGIIVYQEQIMRLARDFAGYSMGEADTIRKAVGKKDEQALRAHRDKFIKGAVERGHSESVASQVWERIAYFANYGFNRSHAAAYARLTAVTAFLKANYPTEFYCATMSSERNDSDRLAKIIRDARRHGLQVLRPDVNCSEANFSIIDESTLRFGLLAIKGVSEDVVSVLIEGRPYDDLRAVQNAIGSRFSKKPIEALIKAGAMDDFGPRSKLIEELNKAKPLPRMQLSMFDLSQVKESFEQDSPGKLREMEEQALGFSLTEVKPPTDLVGLRTHRLSEVKPDHSSAVLCVYLKAVKEVQTKQGQAMAFADVEDESGEGTVVVFPEQWGQYKAKLRNGEWLLMAVTCDEREGRSRITFKQAITFGRASNYMLSGG